MPSIADILCQKNNIGLHNLLPLSMVRTKKDIAKYVQHGYCVGMTADEFSEKYPLLPIDKIYATGGITSSLYYCDRDALPLPIVLCLSIYGDKRLAARNESDEEFQKHILDTTDKLHHADDKRISTYIFSLEDGFRSSVLSKYIENSEPNPELYRVFTRVYIASDYGFGNFSEKVIEKVSLGKSEEQKEKTAKKLKIFPNKIKIYRGEGSKSTPHAKAYSWTTDYKQACFFACRMIDSEDSRIVSAFVNKSDIIEYFSDSSEKEVLVLPSCAKDIHVETLYGVSSLAKEISAIMPTYQVYRSEIAALYECSENDIAGHDAVHTLRVLFNALLLLEVGKIKLTGTEKRQLLTAIVYHDIGRTNDSVDDGHGKASKEIYLDDSDKPDNIIAFLIEYHCIDDDKAKIALDESGLLGKDRVWLLYSVLKDADALDRVRFGMHDVDPRYFRSEVAHKLLPTAHAAVQFLRL